MPNRDLSISMARRYYRRTRVVRPKKKWCSNMRTFTPFEPNQFILRPQDNSAWGFAVSPLVINNSETSTPSPTVIKAGNFKVQGDFYATIPATTSAYLGIRLYVMFVPEGISFPDGATTVEYVEKHPEYILAGKVLDAGSTSVAGHNAFSFSSRMKRNLNSGDRIALIGLAQDGSASSTGTPHPLLGFNMQVQFWTCSN